MFENYRVEVLYFAGRRKFMQMNLPILLDNPLIDCVHIMHKCRDEIDRIWIQNVKINLVGHNTDKIKVSEIDRSIKGYLYHYKTAIDYNTIYIKIDDDVCYIHPNCIQKILEVRLKYQDAKLIYPNIYNNLMIDFIRDKGCTSDYQMTQQDVDEIYGYWKSASHAEYEHRKLLETTDIKETNECFVLKRGFLNSVFMPFNVSNQIRNSINVICFFGKDMKNWFQNDHIDFSVDEYAFTYDVHKPMDSYSILVKDAICLHFSYYTQKISVQVQMEILESYVQRMKLEYDNYDLKYDNTIIISNSCFGGHYDQIVGREHNTPFTWCSISSDNYFKLIENIDTLDLETINGTSIESSFKTTGNDEISWQQFVRLNVSRLKMDIDFIHIHDISQSSENSNDVYVENPEQYAIDCWNRRLARFNRNTIYNLVITDCVRFNWTIEQLEWFKRLNTRHKKFFITSDQKKLDFFKNSSVVPIKMQCRKGEMGLVGCARNFIDVKKYIDLDVVNFVCTHKIGKDMIPFHLHFYNGKVIQGGAVNGRIYGCDYYDDDVFVSRYNPYINEMTSIYWIGKHLSEFNQKYIGLMHYDRAFRYNPSEFINDNMMISSIQHSRNGVLQDLADWHKYKNPIDFFNGLPLPQETVDDIIKTLSESKTFYNFNMFIAERSLFKEYIDFISPLIEHSCKILDSEIDSEKFKSLTDNEKRFYGFCLERLTSYWIEKNRCNTRLFPRCPIVDKSMLVETFDISVENLFKHSFVINIDNERYDLFKRIFTYHYLTIPQKYDGFEIKGFNFRSGRIENSSGINCSYGHTSIIKLAKYLDWPFVCIFEDDAYPCYDIKNKLEYYLKDVPNDCECLMLGNAGWDDFSPFNNKFSRVRKAFGAHAYVIFKNAYDKMIDAYKYDGVCDHHFGRLNTYAPNENLFIQYGDKYKDGYFWYGRTKESIISSFPKIETIKGKL